MKITVSPSQINSFRLCRRRWAWEQEYRSKYPQPPLWIGRLVHAGLDAYYSNERDLDAALEVYDFESKKALGEIATDFAGIWESISDEWRDNRDLGRSMVETYHEYDLQKPLPGDVVATEQFLEADISFTSDGQRFGATLRGRLDLIMSHEGKTYIVDHKTSSSTPNFSGLELDEQMTAYAFLFYREYGELPDHIVYNVLLKKAPSSPRVLKSGALSKDKRQATTPRLYRKALDDHELSPLDYQSFLDYLDEYWHESFFERGYNIRTWDALYSFRARLAYTVLDMLNCRKDPNFIYANPSTWRCGWCPFQAPCRIKQDGGDYDHVLEAEFDKT